MNLETEGTEVALSKNEYIEMDFTGMTAEGAAVGRYEGEAVFVPMGAPGDRALVKIEIGRASCRERVSSPV